MKKLIRVAATITLGFLANPAVFAKCQLIHNIKGYTPVANSNKVTTFEWIAFDSGKVLATGDKNSAQLKQSCSKIDG